MDPFIIPIVAMLIPIIIVPTALGIKHARYLREVEHTERMRAMELGRNLAEDDRKSPTSIAVQVGVWVPLGALAIAFSAPKHGATDAIWMAAGMIGVAGVIGGSILASMQLKAGQAAAASADPKPAYDPDEFDVVGSRG
jgi:hypothetical protein